MEQRTYRGNVSPEGLADYLVNTFANREHLVTQRVGQGDNLLVQIGHGSYSGRHIRNVIGVSITRTGDGVTVGVGQSNWIDLADPSLGGMLIGAIFFPPLLIFPLIHGVRRYALYQDLWNAIDTYCVGAGAVRAGTQTAHGVYCPRCGVLNAEENQFCTACGMSLQQAPQYQQPPAQAAPGQVVCPECHQTVSAGKFCSNCGARLSAPEGSQWVPGA
jgi:uncharacterized paraquat-inducible protein A